MVKKELIIINYLIILLQLIHIREINMILFDGYLIEYKNIIEHFLKGQNFEEV